MVNQPGMVLPHPPKSAIVIIRKALIGGFLGSTTYPVVTFSYALVLQDMSAMGAKGAAIANFLTYLNQVRLFVLQLVLCC